MRRLEFRPLRSSCASLAALLAFGALCAAGSAQEPPSAAPETPKKPASERFADWARKQIFGKLEISGFRRLGYHVREVSGDREAHDVTTNFGLGGQTFTSIGSVQIGGREIFGGLEFEASIEDSRRRDPQAQTYNVRWRQGKWRLDYGDFQGSLANTNSFARFNKSLNGVAAAYRSGGFEARAIRSEVKGEARTISITGNNTPGPYFLQSSQIVRGSERIQLDGRAQALGSDYVIDYDLGSITFVNAATGDSRIIAPTSTIVASYEAFSFSGDRGTLEAAGASYDFGASGRIGLTLLSQKTGSGNASSSVRQESFQGFGPAGSPYILQFTPLASSPIVIRLDGILQSEGVDYQFDTENPSVFYFNRFVPASSTIDVLYTPQPTSTASGDREVLGIDYRLPINGRGSAAISQATGRELGAGGQEGTAKGLEAAYGSQGLTGRLSLRDVPQSFTGIESVGFARNERLASVGAAYDRGTGRTIDAGWTNSAISRFSGGSATSSRYVRSFLNAGFSGAASPRTPFSLGFDQSRGRTASGETLIDTFSAEARRTTMGWQASASLRRQAASGPATSGSGRRSALVEGLELDLAAPRFGAWTFAGQAGLSRVAEAGETRLGRDLQARAGWNPSGALAASLNFIDSDAGAAALSGFESGAGFGYGGNGFSSGTGTSASFTAARIQEWRLQGSWQPSERASLNAFARTVRRAGSLSSNSRTEALGLDGAYDAGRRLQVDGSFSLGTTESLSSGTQTETFLAALSGAGDLSRRWSWSAASALVLSSGGSFAQDSLQIDGGLRWRLSSRDSMSFRLDTNQVRGYLPQNAWDASITYQRRIWNALALNVGWRARDSRNLDSTVASGAFRSSSLDVELAFNFGF
jgi:hypothetical protein